MNTFDLIEELSKKSKEEIQFALLTLMLNGKIDFIDLNKSYIDYLKDIRNDQENLLAESDTCLMDMLFVAGKKKKRSKIDDNIIQRSLYRINQSNRFNTDHINKQIGYIGDEKAKEFSWYERNKKVINNYE